MQSASQVMIRETGSCGNPAVEAVRARAYQELLDMSQLLNMPLSGYPFTDIISSLAQLLDQAEYLLNRGIIDPYAAIRSAPYDPLKPLVSRTLRVGIYPVAANPFHWAHLLIGLSALVRFRLDNIIYVISGSDPRKPALAPAEIRHLIGEEVLKIFAPFFSYSSIALENDCDGEMNLFKIVSLNPDQSIDLFYIVGADHYHRVNPRTGQADTLQKLEGISADETYYFNPSLHSISAIFIERGTRDYTVETDIPVAFIPGMPFAASSTMIREAFQGNRPVQTLALLPCTAFNYVDAFGLYGSEFKLNLQKNSNPRHNRHVLFSPGKRTAYCPAEVFMNA
jgi:nicotinic acid mononucleotide adenylyltransferase